MEQTIITSNGTVQHGTDKGLYVEFFMHAIEDEEASKAHGRPIFRDVEYIKIIPLGDKNTVMCRPVRKVMEGNVPADTDRWPEKYRAFQNQQIQPEEGTPITEWPPLSKAQALMLKTMNIHTVEALSQVGDHNLDNIGMGARDLRDKAKAFIEASESTAGILAIQDENADLKKQIEAMKAQMDGFAKLIEQNKKQPELAAPAVILQPEVTNILPETTMAEPINFTPATSSYGKRGRPAKNQS